MVAGADIEVRVHLNVQTLKRHMCIRIKLGVHDMQQASRQAEPGDHKHAVNNVPLTPPPRTTSQSFSGCGPYGFLSLADV